MRFGREMNDCIATFHRLRDFARIANIAAKEAVSPIALNGFQVVEIACVSELVVIDDLAMRTELQHIADEVRTDESSSAADEDAHSSRGRNSVSNQQERRDSH